jgi:choline dehydrogenase-like flavoprotein
MSPAPVSYREGLEEQLLDGHVCGTCRFGTDPKSSALDPQNRVHFAT